MTDVTTPNLFEQINEKKAELDRIIKEFGERAIKEYLAEFWNQNPDVLGLRWTQYTPYFNDGDPCVFHVHEVSFRFVDTAEDAGDYEDGYESLWSFGYERYPDLDYHARQEALDADTGYTALSNLNSIWQNNEMTLLSVFGDHVRITADREKIEVDEYEHN